MHFFCNKTTTRSDSKARSGHPARAFALSFFFVLAASSLLFSCGRKEPTPGDIAARTAKIYYDYLLDGKYEAYVDGFYQPDSIPSGYREQLVTNARMFLGEQNEAHRGIDSIHVVRGRADTLRRVGEAFLMFCYADSTREQVVVPMVYVRGVWMMR